MSRSRTFRLSAVGVAVLLATFLITGCGTPNSQQPVKAIDADSFVGEWESISAPSMKLSIHADGVYVIGTSRQANGLWELDGKRAVVTPKGSLDYGDFPSEFSVDVNLIVSFEIDGEELTATDSDGKSEPFAREGS